MTSTWAKARACEIGGDTTWLDIMKRVRHLPRLDVLERCVLVLRIKIDLQGFLRRKCPLSLGVAGLVVFDARCKNNDHGALHGGNEVSCGICTMRTMLIKAMQDAQAPNAAKSTESPVATKSKRLPYPDCGFKAEAAQQLNASSAATARVSRPVGECNPHLENHDDRGERVQTDLVARHPDYCFQESVRRWRGVK